MAARHLRAKDLLASDQRAREYGRTIVLENSLMTHRGIWNIFLDLILCLEADFWSVLYFLTWLSLSLACFLNTVLNLIIIRATFLSPSLLTPVSLWTRFLFGTEFIHIAAVKLLHVNALVGKAGIIVASSHNLVPLGPFVIEVALHILKVILLQWRRITIKQSFLEQKSQLAIVGCLFEGITQHV